MMNVSNVNSIVDFWCNGETDLSQDLSKEISQMLMSLGLDDFQDSAIPSSLESTKSFSNAGTTQTLNDFRHRLYFSESNHSHEPSFNPSPSSRRSQTSLDHSVSTIPSPCSVFDSGCVSSFLGLDSSLLSLHSDIFPEIHTVPQGESPVSQDQYSPARSSSSLPSSVDCCVAVRERGQACDGPLGESDFLMRKLGGFRNIGWTLDHRINENGENEHQALVYSLHTFTSYISPWMVNEHLALKAALTKCYDLEKIEYDNGNNNDLGSTFQRTEEQAEELGLPHFVSDEINEDSLTPMIQDRSEFRDALFPWKPSLRLTSNTRPVESIPADRISSNRSSRVLVWASFVPDGMSSESIVSTWQILLAPTTRFLGVLRTPIPSQGLLVFDDLSSAIDFIRTAKSKQLEFFDLLVARERPLSSHRAVLFHPHSGDAIGFSLVNVSPQHPTCIYTLLRLSQKDTVALGHKRTSTETLRLLLTHPEVSPLMVVPPAQPYTSHSVGRTTPLSQTPSHRRASIWCALCCTQSNDIPSAWKHLSRNPHEALRDARNASLLDWVASEHPILSSTLMPCKRPDLSLDSTKSKIKEIPKHSKGSKPAERRAEASVLEQLNLLKPRNVRALCSPVISREGSWKTEDWEDITFVGRSPMNIPKGLNPEASPFIPGNSNLSSSSPKIYNRFPHRVHGVSDVNWKDVESDGPGVCMSETTILREWNLRQELASGPGQKIDQNHPKVNRRV